ncbi:hypothetical protein ACRAWD_25705 [Caulobacter segnis]
MMMVESEIQELSEEIVLGGVNFAHKEMQAVIDAIIGLAEHAAKEPLRVRAGRHRRDQGRDEGPRRRRHRCRLQDHQEARTATRRSTPPRRRPSRPSASRTPIRPATTR